MSLDDDVFYIDRIELAARGWTRPLQARFLALPDRWKTVDHWQNYTGKACYFLERVIQAEALADFKAAYDASLRRRRVDASTRESFAATRRSADAQYWSWLAQQTPEQIQRRIAIDEMAEAFEEARRRGYRTPHK